MKRIKRKTNQRIMQNHCGQESEIRISELLEKLQASIEKQIKATLDYFPQLKGYLQSIRYDDTIDVVASSQTLMGVVKVSKKFMDYDAMAESYVRGGNVWILPERNFC